MNDHIEIDARPLKVWNYILCVGYMAWFVQFNLHEGYQLNHESEMARNGVGKSNTQATPQKIRGELSPKQPLAASIDASTTNGDET